MPARAQIHDYLWRKVTGPATMGCAGGRYQPRFLWNWPNSRISVMGGEQAAGVLTTVKRDQLAREGKSLSPEEEQRHPQSDPRQVRARRVALLLDRPALGRRHPRSGATRDRRSRSGSRRRINAPIPPKRSTASSGCDR